MRLVILFSFIAFVLIFVPNISFGEDININADLENDPVGPNDWIKIDILIDGYIGGEVDWIATLPSGETDSGSLTSFNAAGKTVHTITRNALDNQHGTWEIEYTYKDITETIEFEVEELNIEILSDKSIYFPEDDIVITLGTNYYESTAMQAESITLKILNDGGLPIILMDEVDVKIYAEFTNYVIPVYDILANNPLGTYTIHAQYFNAEQTHVVEITRPDLNTSIFVSPELSLYKKGDIVQITLIISDLIGTNAVITVTNPNGVIVTEKNMVIDSSLTRLTLHEVATDTTGTYRINVDYGNSIGSTTFAVEAETLGPASSSIDLNLSLNKQHYQPGESIFATVTTDQLIFNEVTYWLENPSGVITSKTSQPMVSGNEPIVTQISKNAEEGPWKMYVSYGNAQDFAIFFVEGDAITGNISNMGESYTGPPVTMMIDGNDNNFKNPQGIGIDSNNNIYVVDSGNSEIKKFSSTGRLLSSWGSFGSSDGQLKTPVGIHVDSEHVYVADKGNSRIQTFDKSGVFVNSWGKSQIKSQSLVNPVSITKDPLGNFFIADAGLNKILKYSSDGRYAGFIDPIDTAAAKFTSSNSIVSDQNNNLFILISNDNRILQYRTDGSFVKSFGTQGNTDGKFDFPTSLTIDSKGNLYVSDSKNHRIQVFTSDGKFIQKWGSFGAEPGQFKNVSYITLDTNDNVYVVDSSNVNRVQKFDSVVDSLIIPTDELMIPEWIRNNAKWWNEGNIADNEFVNGIQYMIKENIIVIPKLENSVSSTEQTIPVWIKNNAGWWADGQISDKEFANGIEYLVKNGIIQV